MEDSRSVSTKKLDTKRIVREREVVDAAEVVKRRPGSARSEAQHAVTKSQRVAG